MSTLGHQLAVGGTLTRVSAGTRQLVALSSPAFIAPSPGWVVEIGVWAKRTDSDSRLYLGLYSRAENGEPLDLLGRTARLTPSAGGGNLSAAVAATLPAQGGPATAIRLEAGQLFLPAVKVEGSAVDLGTVPDGAATHYRRNQGSGPPVDRFNPADSVAGALAGFYVVFQPNSGPAVTLTAPAADAFVNTLTPTFVGGFSDPNSGAPTVDRLREYQIEVRQQGQLALLWGGQAAIFPATSSERAAAAFSRIYSGSALAGGTTYEWRAAVADDTLTYSDWSGWRAFTINALGQVTGVGPTGKVDTAANLIGWQGRWYHPQGHSADRVQVRVLKDGTLLKVGGEVTPSPVIASSALPGTLFTIASGAAGIGTLPPGNFTFQIRGRSATGGQWSPWSDETAFVVNSPPTVPANLQPPDGTVSTTRPLLEFDTYDPDADDVGGVDTLFEIEITRPSGSPLVLTFQTTNYDADRGTAFFQTTNTEVNGYGRFSWRARSQDVSAGSLGWSAWSKSQSFDYVAGPVVTITAPTEGATVGTSTPAILWTAADQQKFQVRLYRKDQAKAFFTTGPVVSATGSYVPPAGKLKNGDDVDVDVTVWNSGNVAGTSLRRRFRVVYVPAPAISGFAVSGYQYPPDPEPTAALLSWDYANLPPGDFGGYNVYVRDEGEPESSRQLLQTIRNLGQNRWIDPHLPHGRPTIYGVTQLQRVGADLVESPAVEATFTLDLHVVVIAAVDDPGQRSVLVYHPSGSKAGRSGKLTRPQQQYVTWGSLGRPTTVRGRGSQRSNTNRFWLIDDGRGSKEDHLDALLALWDAAPPTEDEPTRGVVSFRDNVHAYFGQITNVSYEVEDNAIAVTVEVAETAYSDRARRSARFALLG